MITLRRAPVTLIALAGALAAWLQPVHAVTRPVALEQVARAAEAIAARRVDAALRDPGASALARFLIPLNDPARAGMLRFTFDMNDVDLGRPGHATVVAELADIVPHERTRPLDPVFGNDPPDQPANPGFTARLQLTVRATAGGATLNRVTSRRAHLTDVSPVAPHHTLFIHSKASETLRGGTFTLRNAQMFGELSTGIRDLVAKLPGARPVAGESAQDAVDRYTRDVSLAARVDTPAVLDRTLGLATRKDITAAAEAVKNLVDNLILKQNPRRWGRVRTNGVLQVYAPLWSPDDVVNYTADGSVFGQQRPEIGYPGCDNRLADPFMNVYTHFEGYIYKNYRRAAGSSVAVVPPQRYTINTRMNYVLRYPERAPLPGLERLEKSAPELATVTLAHGATISGQGGAPLELGGIWYSAGSVRISGAYRGRGQIVAAGDIVIDADVTAADAASRLSLVSLGGRVHVRSAGSTRLEAWIYARDGLAAPRSASVRVIGNLAVGTLNRDAMPGTFECWYKSPYLDPKVSTLTGGVAGVR